MKIGNRLADALPAEAVETPEEQKVELSVFGGLEDLVEPRALAPPFAPGLVIDVFAGEPVAFLFNERAQLAPLVFLRLPSVAGGDAQVDGRVLLLTESQRLRM